MHRQGVPMAIHFYTVYIEYCAYISFSFHTTNTLRFQVETLNIRKFPKTFKVNTMIKCECIRNFCQPKLKGDEENLRKALRRKCLRESCA